MHRVRFKDARIDLQTGAPAVVGGGDLSSPVLEFVVFGMCMVQWCQFSCRNLKLHIWAGRIPQSMHSWMQMPGWAKRAFELSFCAFASLWHLQI